MSVTPAWMPMYAQWTANALVHARFHALTLTLTSPDLLRSRPRHAILDHITTTPPRQPPSWRTRPVSPPAHTPAPDCY